MNSCASDKLLEEYARQLLSDQQRLEVETHLEECDQCCMRLSQWSRDDAITSLHSDRKQLVAGTSHLEVSSLASSTSSPAFQFWKSATHVLSSTSHVDQLPDNIGRYRVESLLGSGGFGKVVAATDNMLGRRVAIKVPHAKLGSDPHYLNLIMAEAKTVARLDHPHIVPIYDVGSCAEFPVYLVTKLIEGANLARQVHSNVKVEDAVRWTIQVADALQYAHSEGIIHRDVKPQNIIIEKSGNACLTDFGLAWQAQGQACADHCAGTPAYMSPEQRDRTLIIDHRTDIFSLGKVLTELLDCEPSIAEAKSSQGSIAEQLKGICAKATQTAPTDRFQSAGELAAALRQCAVQAGWSLPVSPAAINTLTPRSAELKRLVGSRTLWISVGLVATLIVAAIVALMIVAQQRRELASIESYLAAPTSEISQRIAALKELTPRAKHLLEQVLEDNSSESRKLRALAALVPYQAELVPEFIEHMLSADIDLVSQLYDVLWAINGETLERLWTVLSDDKEILHRRLNAAVILAHAAADDPRWKGERADTLVRLMEMNTGELLVSYGSALSPVRSQLIDALKHQLAGTEIRVSAATLRVFEIWNALVTTDFDASFELLGECPVELSDAIIHRLKDRNESELVSALRTIFDQRPDEPDSPATARFYRRQFLAAYALLRLGSPAEFWSMWNHTSEPDRETVANYLVADSPITINLVFDHLANSNLLDPLTQPAATFDERLFAPELSQRRQLLLTLYRSGGWFGIEPKRAEAMLNKLRTLAVQEADPGMQAVVTWMLKGFVPQERWAAEEWLGKSSAEATSTEQDWSRNSLGMAMIHIRDAAPLSHDFALSQYEVEQRTFHEFVRQAQFDWSEPDVPARQIANSVQPLRPQTVVSWYDCAAFCNWLSRREGLDECYEPNAQGVYAQGMRIKPDAIKLNGYRLPREAEWTTACRAGASTRYASGNLERYQCAFGWTRITGTELFPVGCLPPNSLGFHDMHGNASEWILDMPNSEVFGEPIMDKTSRQTRGGSFKSPPPETAWNHAETYSPARRYTSIGFRLARSL